MTSQDDKPQPEEVTVEDAFVITLRFLNEEQEENKALLKDIEDLRGLLHEHVTTCNDCLDAMIEGYTQCGDCSCD